MASDSSGKYALIDELAEEIAARYRRGERPALQEYLDRYPDLADDLRELFPAMVEMEQIREARWEAGAADPEGSAASLEQLGDFRILREIGRGGMGIVYEAEQISLGRHVAVKVLPRKMLLEARAKRRFEREAKAAAKLHHTNIVPVHGVGEHDGLPYYVMQFIQGLGLDEVLEELRRLQQGDARPGSPPDEPLRRSRPDVSAAELARSLRTGQFQPAPQATVDESPDAAGEQPRTPVPTAPSDRPVEALPRSSSSLVLPGQSDASAEPSQAKKQTYWQRVAQLGVQVAQALAYAHSQGILHRDIKPSNLLLDTQGTVWITDFGLAKAADSDDLTHTGDIVGTLRYMGPERFQGQADPRSDIYSLGLTLYELLTLRPAFVETDRNQLMRRILHDETPRPRQLQADIPHDLETIVLKASAREPAHRYATAMDLADDLKCFLEDRPIRARPVRTWERAVKWARRRPAVAALVAVSFVALLSLLGQTLWHNAQLGAALYDSLLSEVQVIRKARESGYRAKVFCRLTRAMQLATPKKNLLDLRQEAALCLGDFVGLEPIIWQDFAEAIWAAALRPDGSLLAMGMDDGIVLLRRIPDGKQMARLTGHRSAIAHLAFRAEGNELVSTDWTGVIKVWRVNATGRWTCTKTLVVQRTFTLVTPSLAFPFFTTTPLSWSSPFPRPQLTAATLTPDGSYVAASWNDSTVALVDLANGMLASQFVVPNGEQVESPLAVSPDGKLLAGGFQHQGKSGVLVWDVQTRALHKGPLPPLQQADGIRFSADGKLFVCTHPEEVVLYDTATFQRLALPFERGDVPFGVAFSPDSRFLAYHSRLFDAVRLWDLSRNRYTAALGCDPAFWLEFSKDGKTLVAVGSDQVRTWNLAGAAEKLVLEGHAASISSVVFSPDGQLLATSGEEQKVKVWNSVTGTLLKELNEFSHEVESLSFSPDGRILAAANYEADKVLFYDVESWKPLTVLPPLVGDRVSSIAFSADGQYFAAAGADALTLWRVVRGGWTVAFQLVGRFPQEDPGAVCFSSDGNWLAWRNKIHPVGKCRVHVWDIHRSQPHALSIATADTGVNKTAIGFCPQSNELVFVNDKGAITLWDPVSERELQSFGGGELERGGYAHPKTHLSADGAWYAAGRRAVTVWDLKTQKVLVTLSPGGLVSSIGWSLDRELLAVGNHDGSLEIWNLPQVNARLTEIGLGW